MYSNIHRNPGKSAGIVDMALCVESEDRGFKSLRRFLSFSYFLHQGMNIAQNIKNVMFLLLFVLLFFSSCCIKVKRPYHETYAPVICNHAPARPGGGRGIAEQMSRGFLH